MVFGCSPTSTTFADEEYLKP